MAKKTAKNKYFGKDHHRKMVQAVRSRGAEANLLNRKRIIYGVALVFVLLFVMLFRLAYWQIVRADDLNLKAAEMQKMDTELEPVRGNIYDTNGKVLAQTVMEYELYGYSQNLYKDKQLTDEQKEKNVADLASLTGVSADTIRKRLSGEENLVLLAEGLGQETIQKAEKQWNDNIVVRTKMTRSYPNGVFASQVLGAVTDDNSGRIGLEYQYNSVLSGVKGRVIRTTDSQGNALAVGSSRSYEAQDGGSIVTTIDEVIHHYVEDAIAAGMEETGAEAITAVVMDPKTGNVLAMASTPSYDPNNAYEPADKSEKAAYDKMSDSEKSDYLSRMWTNPAISGVYEPGSTFKLVTAAAALDSGTETLNSHFYCSGSIDVDGTVLHCWVDGAHGDESLTEAVGNSCNPALARVALNLGKTNFYNYIRLFGFFEKTGIDLPGEGQSIVQNINNITSVDLATMGFGQGIAITPIQLMTAVNAIGNNGVVMQPKIVKQILNADGTERETIEDREVRTAVSEDTAAKMREIMEYYVSEGGGTSAYIPGYRVGGKTGTANIAEGGSYSEQTVASFLAMAPMDDPQISVLVMVTRPKKSIYGAANAGPIVREILEQSLVYLGVERKYSEEEEAQREQSEVTVPNVTGLDSSAAIKKLQALGLKTKAMPEGTSGSFHVVDQYPKAGDKMTSGGTVYLYSE